MLRLLKGLGVAGLFGVGAYYVETQLHSQKQDNKEQPSFQYAQGNIETLKQPEKEVDAPSIVVPEQTSSQKIQAKSAEPSQHQPTPIKLTQEKLSNGKFICQMYPMNKFKVHGIARINGNILTSIDCTNPSSVRLAVSVYEFGGNYQCDSDLTEGESALGRRLVSLGDFSTTFQQNLQKQITTSEDILGRSLVLHNESGQMVAAGVIAWANV